MQQTKPAICHVAKTETDEKLQMKHWNWLDKKSGGKKYTDIEKYILV